jgi:hypothetical protein
MCIVTGEKSLSCIHLCVTTIDARLDGLTSEEFSFTCLLFLSTIILLDKVIVIYTKTFIWEGLVSFGGKE